MGVKEIWVVRHGFREDWVNDDPYYPTGLRNDPTLSDSGRKQSQELAEFLKDKNIDRVYSSPFYRVLETVYPFIEKSNVPLYVDYSMAEWYGKAHGRYLPCAPLVELKKLFPKLNIDDHHSCIPLPNGIETVQECHVRVKKGLDLLLKQLDSEPNPPHSIVLAGHAASAICAVRGLLKNANYPVHCGTCSLSKLVRSDNGASWELVMNGSCDHLSEGEQRSWMFTGDVPDYEVEKTDYEDTV
ncbi:histidine phosphatase superfamily [Mycotypha africana]|uniref:histidine phosphatase superfamily n=1 Tax=Mycotypha africana TaxID=64632 RepID=UPI0023011690|nr:histidine phosphatase superfamily [Mycotypha africana]KAI8971722.1 histidine phosphatase superfamily [Mycotypha africana]